jgi:hypothetical protein
MAAALIAVVIVAVPAPRAADAADINQRTAILCVSRDVKTLISIPAYGGDSRRDRTVSSFTQWMFEAEGEPRPQEIRFLWIPPADGVPPELKIATTDSRHGIVKLLSQTRHDLLVATSASSGQTNVGWMFAINFKAEQVIATSVYSNIGGGRGRAFSYDCRFDNETPHRAPAPSGGDANG